MPANKKKIINDPVYGFISIPSSIIFDLIEHPIFQRLRRIKQLGLTHYVYPGALHTRFHHALGAMHLMTEAMEVLRSKGTEITDEEAEAVTIAILLHDIGHGPFSHALEHTLVNVHHEDLSLWFMEQLNKEFDGRLDLAIRIFMNEYQKPFLYQLVSGQLDMDRMDYLTRDSYFTGVSEGVIGYSRIIKMLAVHEGELVVEEKGIYSLEKFLVARRLMYWQAYLHKTVLSAEQMLIRTLHRAKELASQGHDLAVSKPLHYFLYSNRPAAYYEQHKTEMLTNFALLDDFDIVSALKTFANHDDFTLAFLAKGLINRKLFKIKIKNTPFESDFIEDLRQKVINQYREEDVSPDYLVFTVSESNSNYDIRKNEIKILFKDNTVIPMSATAELGILPKEVVKYYLCFPKLTTEK
ncbi:MAG: HD domain-containing protein [Bacteroidota bacterium]